MQKQKVYIETTVVSYLTAKRSRDLIRGLLLERPIPSQFYLLT